MFFWYPQRNFIFFRFVYNTDENIEIELRHARVPAGMILTRYRTFQRHLP